MDVVYDPACPPPKEGPGCRKPIVNWVKFPAFNQPPFFAKPLIKARSTLVIQPGEIGILFDREIADRQRVIVSLFGIDLAPIAPLMNAQLEFWFQLGKVGVNAVSQNVIPLFDDQNPTSYGGSTPIQSGRTTVMPGSVENPMELFKNGMQFGVRGRAQLQGLMENKSAVAVTIRAILGFYQYWSSGPGGASEFEAGDFQV